LLEGPAVPKVQLFERNDFYISFVISFQYTTQFLMHSYSTHSQDSVTSNALTLSWGSHLHCPTVTLSQGFYPSVTRGCYPHSKDSILGRDSIPLGFYPDSDPRRPQSGSQSLPSDPLGVLLPNLITGEFYSHCHSVGSTHM